MKQLKIKDNSHIKKSDFSLISNLTSKICDKTLDELEKEGVFVFSDMKQSSGGLVAEEMILQSYNDLYRAGNVMGFLGYGDERLIIDSRFSTDENDYFLQYLLSRALDFPSVINFEASSSPSNKILNILVFLFPQYLKNAMRKGILKIYIKNQYNNSSPKGTIDVDRHIKQNTPFIGKIAYNQREHSYDNYITELIRHTIEYIKTKQYGNRVLRQVKDEVKLIVDATPKYQYHDKQKIITLNKKHTVNHAYFREYRMLQQLCILILQCEKHQMGIGTNKVYGLLFDGAWLWEEYLNLIIGDIFYHPMNKASKGAQRLFSHNTGLIYPDFISKGYANRIIADVKYKPINNIGNHDYLQMLAYMLRFDSKQGIYLYPEINDTEKKILYLNKGSTYEGNVAPRADISVIKLGFKIPSSSKSYQDFVDDIKLAEHNFKKSILDVIK